MFRPGTSPFDFHQSFKGPNYFTKKDQCEDNNFPGKFASDGLNLEGTNTSKGIINFSIKSEVLW